MKKVLFIDRDGTLIVEPKKTCQVDSWEKLEFYPGALIWLSRIANELDYELVVVTNQDGLGTEAYPKQIFDAIQKHIINTFQSCEVIFSSIYIDSSFPHENKPTRKPGVAMLQKYFSAEYDLKNSLVIGDRFTDIKLAKNLNCKCIWLNENGEVIGNDEPDGFSLVNEFVAIQTTDWKKIYEFLKFGGRTATVNRNTNETKIKINLQLDGNGKSKINTGISFFNHMLEQLAKHSLCDLEIDVNGDLHIDEHHTIEDTAIAIGEALKIAIGNKIGIERYGFCLPMDDCEAKVSIDFSGRPWLVWNAEFKREKIGEMPTEMFMHFFKSLSDTAMMNINIEATGQNEHHKIEAIFKSFAKSIKMAKQRDFNNLNLPSTKGVL